jgi:hypothetical protein
MIVLGLKGVNTTTMMNNFVLSRGIEPQHCFYSFTANFTRTYCYATNGRELDNS